MPDPSNEAVAALAAKRFHEIYERLAPDFGYKTREASAVPWEDVPEANRDLMIATCAEWLGIFGMKNEDECPPVQDGSIFDARRRLSEISESADENMQVDVRSLIGLRHILDGLCNADETRPEDA